MPDTVTDEWKKMADFGDWLIIHGIFCSNNAQGARKKTRVREERVGVVLVHQGAETLMKSYLKSKNISVTDMGFKDALDKIEIEFTNVTIDFQMFRKFSRLRNKIYHRLQDIPEGKNDAIKNFLAAFKIFYGEAFPGRTFNHENLSRSIGIHTQNKK